MGRSGICSWDDARDKKSGGKRLLTRVVPTLLYAWWPRYLDSRLGRERKAGWCWGRLGSGQEGSALSNRISGPSCPSVIASPFPRGFPLLPAPSLSSSPPLPSRLSLYSSTTREFAPIMPLSAYFYLFNKWKDMLLSMLILLVGKLGCLEKGILSWKEDG